MASSEPRPPVAAPAAPGGLIGRVWSELDARFHLQDVVKFAGHKVVPVGQHSTVWYYFGGVTMFFFMVQIITGLLLLMYYQPGENTSYESMKYVVTKVRWGWLIRSTHCWSAHLMTLSLLVHMFSVYFAKAYRYPREITWFTGFFLYSLVLTFGFSGYLLPWNELSFFATAVGTDSVKSIPVIGHWLLRVLRGGDEVTIHTLYRFFALHVCLLPMAAFGLIGLHVLLIQRQGMAEPVPGGQPHPGPRRGMRFVPNFMARDMLLWIVCLNVLGLLAVWLPYGTGIAGMHWDLGAKADPLMPAYPGIKPEWYFLWIYQLLREFPAHVLGVEGPEICLLVVNVLLGVWLLIPVLDRNAARNRPSPAFTDFGAAALYFVLFLTLKAWDLGVPAKHGEDPTGVPGNLAIITTVCAGWTFAAVAAGTLLRWFVLKSRFLGFTALIVLHLVLHAYLGLSYVLSGAIVAVLTLALVAALAFKLWRQTRAAAVATPVALLVALALFLSGTPEVRAADAPPAVEPPAEFKALLDAVDDQGHPVLDAADRKKLHQFPPHVLKLFYAAATKEVLAHPAQVHALLGTPMSEEKLQMLLQDNCVLCHLNPDLHDNKTLIKLHREDTDPLRHLDLRAVLSDVHLQQGLACAGCHGGKPTDEGMDDEIYRRWPKAEARVTDRTWIPAFCARCHADPALMRRYNPSLPIDQFLKYSDSQHGKLLLQQKDSKAAQCVSCHGAHGIVHVTAPASPVYPKNQPDTCGKCHANADYMKGYTLADGKPIPTNQVADYKLSTHGKALFEKGDLGVAVCNDCHGNHAAMPPSVASISKVCRTCHMRVGELYDASPHSAAFREHGWPECETCHGKHHIQKLTFDTLAPTPDGLCVKCHKEYGKPECLEAAAFFHQRIQDLLAARTKVDTDLAKLQEDIHSLDMDDFNFRRDRLDDQIKDLRLQLHSFNREDLTKSLDKAAISTAELIQSGDQVRADYQLRLLWLLASTAIISLVAFLLWLKIKDLDRQFPLVEMDAEPPPAEGESAKKKE